MHMIDRENLTKQQIADGYDAMAEVVGLEKSFYDRCIAMHPSYSGKVLDIGCGQGFLLQKLGSQFPAVQLYGLDISPKLCEITKRNNPQAEVVVGDAEKLPFEDSMFDYVFMTEALEHMQNFDAAVAQITRVLKPQGIAVVTVPNRDWASYEFYDKIRNKKFQPIDDHYFRYNEIVDLLTRNGLRIEKTRGSDNLYYYGWKHRVEEVAAFFIPFLQRKMKRLIFRCAKAH